VDGHRYLRAEVAYAVTHEGALHAEDVLARRVRLLIEASDGGLSAAPEVVTIMAGLLGWNRRRRAVELRRYQDFATANAAALVPEPVLPEVPAAVPVPA
jgi:glycerol-3-phosphate dehydrogenase